MAPSIRSADVFTRLSNQVGDSGLTYAGVLCRRASQKNAEHQGWSNRCGGLWLHETSAVQRQGLPAVRANAADRSEAAGRARRIHRVEQAWYLRIFLVIVVAKQC